MKKSSKLFAVILASAISALAMTGCGNKDGTPAESSAPASSDTASVQESTTEQESGEGSAPLSDEDEGMLLRDVAVLTLTCKELYSQTFGGTLTNDSSKNLQHLSCRKRAPIRKPEKRSPAS